jgi:uncharacterized cysteine cluster protein YcgN (CxxCxxCC family)
MVRVNAGERKMTDEFWKRKSLSEMSGKEWESLCDGCALCCLQKLEDDETGDVYFTDLACRLLDVETCRCCDYADRSRQVANCLVLSADNPDAFRWLPATCAYRRLSAGQALPDWHPLISGDPELVHEMGISAKGKMISENDSAHWTILRKLGD